MAYSEGTAGEVLREDDEEPSNLCASLWRQLRDTANPSTLHSTDLSPEELSKHASFESLDYYKPYPNVYIEHLREIFRERRRRRRQQQQQLNVDGGASAVGSTITVDASQQAAPPPSTSVGPAGTTMMGIVPLAALTYDEEERHAATRWLLHILIAASVAVVATVVSYSVDIIEGYRESTLHSIMTQSRFRVFGYIGGYIFCLLVSVAFVAVSTWVVVFVEPRAAGGGIPDVMSYLNGVHVRGAMGIRTFLVKAVSCVCAVASGLPVGLEAPLIHLGAITGAGVTQGRSRTLGIQTTLFKAFRNNKDRRDFITAGAACGVSAAFGAPIGGLLFVMEEVCSFWDHSASGQIFLATMISFTVTTMINSVVEDRRLLGWVSNMVSVLFEVNLTIPLNLISIVPALGLGTLLGSWAAFFTKANLLLVQWRRRHLQSYRWRRVAEPIVIVAVFSSVCYAVSLMGFCESVKPIEDVNDTILVWGTEDGSRLFNSTCTSPDMYSPLASLHMATGKDLIRHLFSRQTAGEFPAHHLFMYFLVYSVFACWTTGTAISGGLVVPSLVIGALFGRLYGLVMWFMFAHRAAEVEKGYLRSDAWTDPGVFALIGAGAFLAGTSRMSMSICVIMVELSAELHYLLPVMVAIAVSKSVADWLCEPLYHQMLALDCVPYLPANLSLPELEQLTAAEVMAINVVMLRRCERPEVVLRALRHTTHHAFPVVNVVTEEEEEGKEAVLHTVLAPGARGGSAAPACAIHPHTRTPGDTAGKRRHYKFVGLVTREDLEAFFMLPALKNYSPPPPGPALEDAPAAAVVPVTDPESDGFGGRLVPCVLAVNQMKWPEWVAHKHSLFLHSRNSSDGGRNGGPGATDVVVEATEPPPLLLPPVVDLSLIINRSPWVIPPFFNVKMAYSTFQTMGLRHMVVVDGGTVCGMITRKDLLADTLRRRMREALVRRQVGPATSGSNDSSGRVTPGTGRAYVIDGGAAVSRGSAAFTPPAEPRIRSNSNATDTAAGPILAAAEFAGPDEVPQGSGQQDGAGQSSCSPLSGTHTADFMESLFGNATAQPSPSPSPR